MGALMLALMTVRDLPPAQRAAWENLFRHYVFHADDETTAHIPENARRCSGDARMPTSSASCARIVLARLNR